MGSCCGCGIKADPVDDELVEQSLEDYHSDKNSRVIQLTEQSPKHLIEEVTEMLTVSFAGSTTSAPEGTLSWILDPEASGDDPSLPLLEDPTEDRLAFCRFVIKLCIKFCLPQRTCFALIKEGKVVSAALTRPPSTKLQGDEPNAIYMMCLSLSLGVPTAIKDKNVKSRFTAGGEANKRAHEKWAPSPHWYLMTFASDPEEQGKGYGREMMGFITNLADKTGHPIYLETYGPRNERFYSRNGFELKQRTVLKTEDESLEKHGGEAAMVRPPNM